MQMNDLSGQYIGRHIRFGEREGYLVRILHEQNQHPYVRVLSVDLLNSWADRVDSGTEVEVLPQVEIIEESVPGNELDPPAPSATV